MLNSVSNALALINIKELFNFTSVTNLSQSDRKELIKLGKVYFVYLFIYSGLEFTLTFLTHHIFNYTSMQQGWMFFAIGKTNSPFNPPPINHIYYNFRHLYGADTGWIRA